jgi:O-antigen/teichoic acid export membrane protein
MTMPGDLPDMRPVPSRLATLSTPGGPAERGQGQFAGHMFWASASNLSLQGAQFVAFLVLARLLTPADFGLAAIVSVVIYFAQILTDLGLNSALIQTAILTRDIVMAAFWVNMVTGLALTLITWATSGLIAQAFGEPKLGLLLRLASLTFSFSAAIVQTALLERSLKFRFLATVEASAALIGYGTAVTCGALGLGAPSIVVGPVITAALITLILWIRYPFLPTGRVSREALNALWHRAGGVAGFQVINYWARNLDTISLGLVSTPTEVGLYSRAYSFMMAPVMQVTTALSRVLLPSLAKVRHDAVKFREAYLGAIRLSSSVMFPVTIFMATASSSIVTTLLGAKWRGMIPILFWLALSGPPQILSGSASAVYQAASQIRALFVRGAIQSTITMLCILAGLSWGPKGVAFALCVRFYGVLPYDLDIPLRVSGLTWRALLRGLRGVILATATMGLTVAGIGAVWSHHWICLPLQFAVGASVYLAGLYLFDRSMFRALVAGAHLARPRPAVLAAP